MDFKKISQKLSEQYSKKIAVNALFPNNLGVIADFDAKGKFASVNGEFVEFYLKLEQGYIENASFIAKAGSLTIASASLLTSMCQGLKLNHALKHVSLDVLLEEIPEISQNEQFKVLTAYEAYRKAVIAGFSITRNSWKKFYSR